MALGGFTGDARVASVAPGERQAGVPTADGHAMAVGGRVERPGPAPLRPQPGLSAQPGARGPGAGGRSLGYEPGVVTAGRMSSGGLDAVSAETRCGTRVGDLTAVEEVGAKIRRVALYGGHGNRGGSSAGPGADASAAGGDRRRTPWRAAARAGRGGQTRRHARADRGGLPGGVSEGGALVPRADDGRGLQVAAEDDRLDRRRHARPAQARGARRPLREGV